MSWSDVVKFCACPEPETTKPPSTVALPNIPDEIITSHILPRLPIGSLLRFKCACKLWNSVISDPEFSFLNPRSMAVFMSLFDGDSKTHLLYRFLDSDGSIKRVPWMRTKQGYRYENFQLIAGSCDGLLLILLGTDFLLWNPSTRNYCTVLEVKFMYPGVFGCSYNYILCGFCYDSAMDDYKVVLGVGCVYHNHFDSQAAAGEQYVIVAGLKDKLWKEIRFPYRTYETINAVLFNGFLHWRVVDNVEGCYYLRLHLSHKIVAFDPKTDEIQEIPMPRSKNRQEISILGLGILDSCFCMTCWDKETCLSGNFEVFAMKEYGNEESWVPLFDIWNLDTSLNPCPRTLAPLLRMRNGEVLMSMDTGVVFRYNPKTNKFTHFEAKGGGVNNLFWHGCVAIVESFASPKGYGWNEEQHRDVLEQRRIEGHLGPKLEDEDSRDFDSEDHLLDDNLAMDLTQFENFMNYHFEHSFFFI
ncbi:F-box/kelch-repeat protein At3g23880 [Coffea eugenioides]|uniref:F-box/kelch-repeat protein At3g23880 n=1 Tax=Coffea eugenioides TaxID=49369 RepID=UPI000F61167C|nr:F-box/kelch-repeat protein At3g23880 [Coffea eugenioides]